VLVLFVPFVNDLCYPASCSHRLERDNIVLSEIVCEAQMLFLRRSWELKHQLPAVSQVNCKLACTLLIWSKIVASVVTIDCTRLKQFILHYTLFPLPEQLFRILIGCPLSSHS